MSLVRLALLRRGAIDHGSFGVADTAVAGRNMSGVHVGEASSLTIPAVFAAVRVIAWPLAYLPVRVVQNVGATRRVIEGHAATRVLHGQPNPLMTPVVFRALLETHRLLWGNGYAFIERNPDGSVRELWPIHPGQVTVDRRGKSVFYRTWSEWYGTRLVGPEDMFHLKGMSLDGIRGLSAIGLHRQGLGIAKAAEETAARMYSTGIRASGVIQYPKALTPKARENLEASFAASHSGLENLHRPMVLEEGATWEQITIPPEDMQFLETRKFQVSEVARIFGVPPHKIGDLDRATFSNIEHQALEYVTDTLTPPAQIWEQEARRKLLAPSERDVYHVKWNLAGLLKGDIKSRMMAYGIGRQWGWYSANDVLAKEDENPIPNGDIYLTPANMLSADALGDAVAEDDKKPADEGGSNTNDEKSSRTHRAIKRLRQALAAWGEHAENKSDG